MRVTTELRLKAALILGVWLGIVAVAFLLISRCTASWRSFQEERQSHAPPYEVQAAVAVGQTQLENSLKDAPSAKFRGRFVSRAGDDLVYCGEVNAKNGFGGYNGFRRFIARPGDPVIIDGEAPLFDAAWSAECVETVYVIDN